MRLAAAMCAILMVAGSALGQGGQPASTGHTGSTGQPAATSQPAATGHPAATAQPAATGQAAGTGLTVQPVKPEAVPVPEGPVLKTQELEGGIVAEDIKIGDGYEVKPGGAVVAFYHGTLKANGQEFDSAFKRGEPAAFSLSQVIPGWQKGVPGMKVGGVRRLTIPAALAYGAQGRPPTIPANSDLVFVIQLVDAVQMEDVKVGEGEEATGQFLAATTFTITDKDGKEIDKTEAGRPYIWVPNEFQGMDAGLQGMKVGGKRRIHVPKQMNNLKEPGPEGQQPVTIDVDLVAVRNLPPKRRGS